MKVRYFDHAATTPIKQEVLEEMLPYFGVEHGNASTMYSIGRNARRAMNHSRRQVAEAINCNVDEIYLFGSYARNEANQNSDLDFLVFGGRNFKLTMIFSLAEELRAILNKNVDVFEINEINQDSEFYKTIMKERLRVA